MRVYGPIATAATALAMAAVAACSASSTAHVTATASAAAAKASLPAPQCTVTFGGLGSAVAGGTYTVTLDPPYDGSNAKYDNLMQNKATATVTGQPPGQLDYLGLGQSFDATTSGLYSVWATVSPNPGVKLPAATCSADAYVTVRPPLP
jgi:hypothetical protein